VNSDGRFAVQFEGVSLSFRMFDKIQTVQPGTIVENKRLGAALALVKAARQRPPNNLEAPGMPTKGRPSRAVLEAMANETHKRGHAPGTAMMLGGRTGLKGCAARTGKPAPALDPRPPTQQRAIMPFRARFVRRPRRSSYSARGVTFLSGRKSIFSIGDGQ
jgi:hypothetical protein